MADRVRSPQVLGLGAAPAARRRARGLVVALIPAHNEEGQIEAAIQSLHRQHSPPDLVVVCADNGTDRTAEKAEAMGALVVDCRRR